MPPDTHAEEPFRNLETQVLHSGRPHPGFAGAVVNPIFQSANFLAAQEAEYGQVRYIRLNNTPNHEILHARLAAIEGTETALVTGSGMAAISSTLLAFVQSGEHILAHDSLYGGTQGWFLQDAPRLGIGYTAIDCTREEGWKEALRPTTKLIYVEGITNPMMQVLDLEAVVRFARRHGLLAVIDNTIPSPVNFRPATLGFDIVLHSATKYLNGHSDIVAGVVAGSHARVRQVRNVLNHLGGPLDPHACFLLERGLKTLVLRVERQNRNAQALAEFLVRHPNVRRVHYPGLPDDPGHARARRWFQGFGGMLSFYARTAAHADRCLERLRLPVHAASLGGVESLVVRPSRSSHLGLPAAERQRLGVTDELIRVSVGIEAAEDLIADFEQALAGD